MIDLELLFKEKPTIPDWFKTHPVFKDVKKSNKIFPLIGLTNFTIESSLENTNNDQLIRNLCLTINGYINNAVHFFTLGQPYASEKQHKALVDKHKPATKLLQQFFKQLSKPKAFINDFAAKKGLYLQSDIIDVDKKVFARQNESIFKVYAKLRNFVSKNYGYNGLIELEQIAAFKDYSSNNFNGKLKVVFSSDGGDGAWDILTMSQRGIQSCQSWAGQYKNCTIGSVLDPFTAIIYLTSGSKTEYGTKMIRRCIVRFVVDRLTKQPCILLEYMYPSHHAATMTAFKDAIRSKVGDRFNIVDQHRGDRYYVPFSEMTNHLLNHSNKSYVNYRGSHNYYGIFPYRDTFVEYKIKEEKQPIKVLLDTVRDSILNSIVSALLDKTHISNAYVSLIKESLLAEIFNKIDVSNITEKNQYIRQASINYFANKKSITNVVTEKVTILMKNLKDKSILLPGMEATKASPNKKSKSTLKTKAGKLVAPKVGSKTEQLNKVIEIQVMPAISQVFRANWEGIASSKSAKKRVRAPKVKALLR
jgi:hypothetical protein